ncbi:MAG: hypothetical protein HGA67_00270 [Candidatus Yonathbacteria bacterium]|nr:hypothetical protein [Candidatus Yonathbacteria bacterium]
MTQLELLTKAEFIRHFAEGTLRLVFVGMSNTGKSRRAERLMNHCCFHMYSVDEHIARKLGLSDVKEVGVWLGHPDTEGYAERAAYYLGLENRYTCLESLEEIIPKGKNLVFDTTGSVAHLPQETRDWLSDNCLVVYLTLDPSEMRKMVDRFFNVPKPLIWGGFFHKGDRQTTEEALRASYPNLVNARSEKYADMANISIPAVELWDEREESNEVAGRRILDAILKRLPGQEPGKKPW